MKPEGIGSLLPNNPFASSAGRLGQLARERFDIRRSLIEDPQPRLEEARRQAQAQFLFDIAQTAAEAATAGSRPGMGFGERLAEATVKTDLFPKLGQRSADLLKVKDDLTKQQQAVQLSALDAAEAALGQEQKFQQQEKIQKIQLAGDLAKIELSDKLKLKTGQILQSQLGDQRMAQLGLTGQQAVDLEKLKQTGNITLEEYRNANKLTLEAALQENREALATLKGSIDFANRTDLQAQASELQKQNDAYQSQLRINEKGVDLENTLKVAAVKNSYDLAKMDKGQEQNIELANLRSTLQIEQDNNINTFKAAQSALERAARMELQVNDQGFRQLLAEEARRFAKDEADIDRAIAKTQRLFDNAMAQKGFDLKTRQVNLQEARDAVTEEYQLGNLAIAQEAAEADKVGSAAKTATLSYITNDTRLEGYARKQLGDKTTLFEQAILDYINPATNVSWNAQAGRFVQGESVELAPKILGALEKGNPDFYNKVQKILGGEALSETTDRTDAVQPDGGDLPSLANATRELFDPETFQVNVDSPIFKNYESNRFDPDINYKEAIGGSRLIPGTVATVQGAMSELFGDEVSQESKNYKRAQQNLTSLANDVLQLTTADQGDGNRVLKFVQELLEKETEKLRPGGLFARTDSDAKAQLDTISSQLQKVMTLGAQILPEYGGNPGGFSQNQVVRERRTMNQVKLLLGDVLLFQEHFNTPTTRTIPGTDRDQSMTTAKDQIIRMRR